jgi:hypothetical protein
MSMSDSRLIRVPARAERQIAAVGCAHDDLDGTRGRAADGAIVDPVFHRSTLLRVVFLSVGGTGVAAYLYRELFARYFVPIYDYTVQDVCQLNEATLEVALEPARKPLRFNAGQFVFLAFGGFGGWQRHPFSVTGAPTERSLEVTIKAVGDYTHDLYDKLLPGVQAKVAGPFGPSTITSAATTRSGSPAVSELLPSSAGSGRSMTALTARSTFTTRSRELVTRSTSTRSTQPRLATRHCART